MEKIIINAFRQVLKDTLGETPKRVTRKLTKGFLSSIDIFLENEEKDTITFVSSKDFLAKLGNGLFGEEELDEIALKDLSQELANLTIGLAKVLAVTENIKFNISTPSVYGFGEFQDTHSSSFNFSLGRGAKCSLFMHNKSL